jgi:acid phosphatase
MDNDDFHAIPANVSTVVDLLDTKGISWGEYQEGSPYAGFQGFNYSNQHTYANSYVRKHNPLILFESVTNNASRLGMIKNFTNFNTDITEHTLPQWAFITPNMTDDGHDTNITFASTWERNFMTPLLNNSYFMNDTLILLTFDEVETYTIPNKVFSILLGGVIPENLKGTTDNTFYNHYSTIASMSVNWGLPSLGRWDCEANIFAVVANKTGYSNAKVDTTNLYFNASFSGPLSDAMYVPQWPVPNTTAKCASGYGVLASVKATWSNLSPTFNYTNVYPYDGLANINNGGTPVSNGQASSAGGTAGGAAGSTAGGAAGSTAGGTSAPTGSSTSNTSSSSGLSTGAKAGIGVGVSLAALGLAAGVVLWLWKHKRQPPPKESLPPELDGGKGTAVYEADGYVKPSELEANESSIGRAPAPIHELSGEQQTT